MDIFNDCDEKCKNLSRLYFGGKQLVYIGYENRINYTDLFIKYPIIVPELSKGFIPQDNIDITNTFIIMGDKPQTEYSKVEDNYYNIKALRDRNGNYLKAKINNPKIILENNQAFFEYIKSYDLGRLLELKYPTSFRCIFHEDKKPSAGIFQNEEGTYIYHCFSCGKSYNIINLVEVLGNFQSRPKAYKFIREIFNLTIMETEWQTEQKLLIQENRRVLLTGLLEEKCPTTYANIKRNIMYLEQMLMIAEDNIYSEKFLDATGNSVVFYASTKYICKSLGMSENSAKEVSKKNVLFAYHDLINKIADNEIPEEMLKRSQAINVNSPNKSKKHINFYSIPSYTTNWIESNEKKGISWKNNGYNMTGLSREMFYRAEGQEVSDKLYPQYKQVYDKDKKETVDRTTSKKSDERTIKIIEIIFDILTVQKWVTEKEIVDELTASGDIKITKREAERQLKKSLKEILDGYNLTRIRCNKEIKEIYGVTCKSYPFIIVQN